MINTHKSMLMLTLPFFGNTWCNECFLVKRFMKGIFHNKPPLPRYKFTWDVSTVLHYLASLYPLTTLSLKMLTLKVTALIALASAPRAQTLTSMNIDYMVKEQQAVVFTFPNLLKTSRTGHSYVLRIEHFKDEKLCAMHTLLHYLTVTKEIRKSPQCFVSFVTYQSVTSSTIARWLKTVLSLSGIDIDYFKAHSYRMASVSSAFHKGCSIKSILNTADWASDKHFKKFYCRQTLSKNAGSFTKAVLGQ